MGRRLSGKNALAGRQQFEYEKNQLKIEMLNEFRAILETLASNNGKVVKDGKITIATVFRVLARIRKLPKDKTKAFFEDVKNMSKDELHDLMNEARAIVDDVERKVSEQQLISARIKSKRRILEKEKIMAPMFEKKAGQSVDTAKLFEKLTERNKEQEEALSM